MNIQHNINFKDYTTFRIGGPIDDFVVVTSVDGLQEALEYAQSHSIPFTMLGGGSNILADDAGYRGLVIKNEII